MALPMRHCCWAFYLACSGTNFPKSDGSTGDCLLPIFSPDHSYDGPIMDESSLPWDLLPLDVYHLL